MQKQGPSNDQQKKPNTRLGGANCYCIDASNKQDTVNYSNIPFCLGIWGQKAKES